MRLFVAVEISDELRESLRESMTSLRDCSSLRFVSPENVHVTLKYLGEVQEAKLHKVKAALEEVPFSSFRLTSTKYGSFPHVLWLGVKLTKDLAQLQRNVERAVRPFALHDPRAYAPHVTLARFEELTLVEKDVVHALASERLEVSWHVEGFVLFKSTLTPDGPVYEAVGRFPTRK